MEEFMLRKREVSLLVLVLVITAGIFAGGGGQARPAPSGEAAQAGTPGVVTYPVSGNPKITIVRTVDAGIVPGGFSSYNDAPGMKELMRQTGIQAEFIEPVDNNALLLYLAGGNLPDIIYGTKTFYPGGPVKMHADGLSQDLTNLLPQYAPGYWKFINSDDVYYKNIREPDGRYLYFAGYFRVPESLNASWIGLIAREEFLDRLGMAPPETGDELYQYLSRCKNELGVNTPFICQGSGNFAFTEKGNRLVNFGIEGTTYTMVDGRPVYTDFVLNNPNGHTLDGILRAYGILNWSILQDEWMTRQRFPLPSQVDAMEKWGNSDISKYRIINNSILQDHVDEYSALVTDINTFINESQAQFISGNLPMDRFETYYIPGLQRMGIDRLIEILQISYDAYNK